ncbi:hypothetical protein BJ165DRAFT_1535042 [Panaeolus papilionaceus]|nr:hypothetical protein BJ165DRAFT_1535042 [Panaeolus papilionaceus]
MKFISFAVAFTVFAASFYVVAAGPVMDAAPAARALEEMAKACNPRVEPCL